MSLTGCTHILGPSDMASIQNDVATTDSIYRDLNAYDAGLIQLKVKSVHCDERKVLRNSNAEPDAGVITCPVSP
jgi:hypothetical protein